MALDISQIIASSYPAVLANKRKPANQWAENAFMRELQRLGAIAHKSLGPTIECPLDYRRNPGAKFLATDLEALSQSKTEVVTAASYAVAELAVPITWSKKDEATNPSENQKISLAAARIENALNSHDDLIEEALFASTSTNGFLALNVIAPTTGQGSPGGIDASIETFWVNPTGQYQSDGSDIEAIFTTAYNNASKGSGSGLSPRSMVSGSTPHALFESTQTAHQRWVDGKEADMGFKVLMVKGARYVFSQFGGENVYFLNPKSAKLVVSKEMFRSRGKTKELQGAAGYEMQIYSALQFVTDNKSRLAVVDQA
jgi:hypothetical protein